MLCIYLNQYYDNFHKLFDPNSNFDKVELKQHGIMI